MRALPQETRDLIASLSNGERTTVEIAKIAGVRPGYVGKYQRRMGLNTATVGGRIGEKNHRFAGGRAIDLDGYAMALAPHSHPSMRKRGNRRQGTYVLDHRLAVEQKIGRYLEPEEVVDHIDGLTLNNDPENLRIFRNNADHLAHTLAGAYRRPSRGPGCTWRLARARGDVRLRAILQAALSLGTDSPHLLGSHRWLERAGIDWSSKARNRISARHAVDLPEPIEPMIKRNLPLELWNRSIVGPAGR